MSTTKSSGYLWTVLTNKCPRCREGELFEDPNMYNLRKVTKMNHTCPVCGQPTEIEVGFYYGTSYVSYFLAVIVCVISLIAWWLIIGFSFEDSRFFWWLGVNAFLLVALQPFIMRMSRTLWLSWFVRYDPNWKVNQINKETIERIVPEQMGNW